MEGSAGRCQDGQVDKRLLAPGGEPPARSRVATRKAWAVGSPAATPEANSVVSEGPSSPRYCRCFLSLVVPCPHLAVSPPRPHAKKDWPWQGPLQSREGPTPAEGRGAPAL